MRGINKVENMFNLLEMLSEKYSGYKVVPTSSIVYHDPETPEQEEKAKRISKKVLGLYYLVSIAFLASAISSIIMDAPIWVIILLLIITTIFVISTLKTQFKKLQVMTGKAVYKNKERKSNNTGKYVYFISVIPDSGEKVIYRRIQVSENDYEQIKEGTPVMVVNKGTRVCVL